MSLLQVSHLDIAVGDRRLISKLELRIDRGEFWCILGKNGAGKTTLLQVIAGLRSNSKAQIQLCGEALQSTPLALLARRRGLMLQQQLDVFAHTVFDVVAIGQVVDGVRQMTILCPRIFQSARRSKKWAWQAARGAMY